ncbi:hypothetical protein [Vulcanisaeta distributa]|uniref:hypothetical protein n=1 Tax=Vulcanisaeta distributa TaxID=164451 RepID=UPI001FB3B870|nr:hypothetical protein [Vulcanisaeta distributa]
MVRNIAYLHVVKEIALRGRLHMGTRRTAYTVHRLLMESGYNADKEMAKRHRGPVPCKVRLA